MHFRELPGGFNWSGYVYLITSMATEKETTGHFEAVT